MRKNSDLGGVRELSYDPQHARPHGQTEREIHSEARAQDIADKTGKPARASVGGCIARPHVPRPDRFYLLRFLGLDANA